MRLSVVLRPKTILPLIKLLWQEVHFKLIGKIDRASTLSLVFEALVDTILEDDDERILSFFIEGLQWESQQNNK